MMVSWQLTVGSRQSPIRGSILGTALRMVVLCVVMAHDFATGQQAPKQGGEFPAGVEVRVNAEPSKATVGDPIRIDLEVVHPEGYQVRISEPSNPWGEFSILEFYPGPTVPAVTSGTLRAPAPEKAPTDPARRHRARIIAALYKVGSFEFAGLKISLLDKSGRESSFAAPAVKIQIDSVVTEQNPNLKNLKKQADIEEPISWPLWIALGFLLLLVASAAWWYWRKKQRPILSVASLPKIDPLEAAEAELRDLLSRRLLDKGFVKQFYVILSDIVRKMLEAGCEVPTLERTTPEIMDELRALEHLQSENEMLRQIESLLFECDLVKFAKYLPPRSETDAAVKGAFDILRSCKSRKTQKVTEETVAVEGKS
jgi:hypothetical protein